MNTVSKSIKRLRLQNNMTQEELAEKMHVTRQTISKWETEKAQPDINTLTSLADVFKTDIYNLIYGWPREGYKRFQTKYMAVSAISLSCILIVKLFCDYIVTVLPRSFFRWQYIVDMLIPIVEYSLMSILFGITIIGVISLWFDTRSEERKRMGIIGIILIVPLIIAIIEIVIALFRRSFSGLLIYSMSQHFTWFPNIFVYILPAISGICMFLFFNRYSVESSL